MISAVRKKTKRLFWDLSGYLHTFDTISSIFMAICSNAAYYDCLSFAIRMNLKIFFTMPPFGTLGM